MFEENRKNQEIKKVLKEKERQEDIKQQELTAKMMLQQEQDRMNEVKAREERAQAFMNRMADGVLAELDHIQKREDEMIARYEREREMKLRKAEDKKMVKKLKEQKEMCDVLAN